MYRGRLIGSLLAVAAAMVPALAGAQPSYVAHKAVIDGRIEQFDGRTNLIVSLRNGYALVVHLMRHGTIINPRGKRLERGMMIQVRGAEQGPALLAWEVNDAAWLRSEKMQALRIRQFQHAQYLKAHRAANRLAAKLERLYGPQIAHVAHVQHVTHVAHVAHVVQVAHVERRTTPTRIVAGAVPKRHEAHRPALASIPAMEEIQPTWYGWGKL